MNERYAALIAAEHTHARKTPSPTFRAALATLARIGRGHVGEVAEAAGIDRGGASRVLMRMGRLGLAASEVAPGGRAAHGGRIPPRYYRLTEAGQEMARPLLNREGVA